MLRCAGPIPHHRLPATNGTRGLRGPGFIPAVADCRYRAPLSPRLVRPCLWPDGGRLVIGRLIPVYHTSFFSIYQYPHFKFFYLQRKNFLAFWEKHAIIICVSAELLFSSPLYGPVAQLGERTVRIHMDAHHGLNFCFQFLVRFFGLSPQN